MGGVRFCGCGCKSENPFVCFGPKPTQRACAQDHPRNRKRTRERRSQRRVGRREQSREGCSQQKESVKRCESGREETSQQKSGRWLLGTVDLRIQGWPTREDKSALLVACGSFARIHDRDSQQMHGQLHKSITNFSLLALGANSSLWLFVLLFFHSLGCECCVLVKEYEIPRAGDEKKH